MGALPSHETHARGLYSHRHGRNRRNEIILIPLTTAFFPSPDCPLFRHLYNSRYRRTAKYYFRALRSAETPRDSDYFCTTTAINAVEEFEGFYQQYLQKLKGSGGSRKGAGSTATEGIPTPSSPLLPRDPCPTTISVDGDTVTEPPRAAPSTPPQQDCLNARGLPTKVGPMDFRSYTDTREGLYQVLIRDNAPGVFATDEELRQVYWKQLQEQQTERQRAYQRQRERGATGPAAACSSGAGGSIPHPPLPPTSPPPSTSAVAADAGTSRRGINTSCTHSTAHASMLSAEDVSFDEFVSGYVASKRYMKGKALHTHFSTAVAADAKGDSVPPTTDAAGTRISSNEYSAKHYKHVTSPVAYDIRPLPCVIASRYDTGKPPPVDDPLYVEFGGSYLRIMGMFGFLPSTVGMRRRDGSCHSGSSPAASKRQRCFPRKEGHCNGDDDIDEEFEIEQHLLKGTMFVDKDVGDQILGNMVMLATYMYVRQCIEARIHPQAIPMLPVLLRFPLSNIPMLQLVREFRVRLRTLLEAGTAKAGQKPVHTGMSGFNPEDLADQHNPQRQRLEEERYLFEPDVPSADTPEQLFLSAEQASSADAPLRRHAGITTPSCGKYPIIMMSGFNVQSTPLRHPALNTTTGYLPAMADAAQHSSALSTPHSGSASASPRNESGAAGGAGRPTTLPSVSVSPFLVGQRRTASPTNSITLSPPTPPPPPSSATTHSTAMMTPAAQAQRIALLHRRKQRFRIWVEDGHICIWASAAYARRAALIMAQQLNTTVDSNSVPEQRSWNYRGLLHANTTVPPPRHVNDVIVVAEDIPSMDLWQGDVLRCCTQAELQAMIASKGVGPLPLPCPPDPITSLAAATNDTTAHSATPVTSVAAAPKQTPLESTGGVDTPSTSNHLSNPLLQEKEKAPAEAFWVRGAGGLDDSFTNITESNMPPHPKAEKQLLQAAMQRAKKAAAAAAATAQSNTKKKRLTSGETTTTAASPLFIDIDRREGTLNIEEVVLAWIKVVSILTRDSTEEDRAWVRDPQGNPVRVDRYVIRRYEHDGVRFFIGVTPRFVGQQRRIEKVLGEVYAIEEREGRYRCEQIEDDDGGDNEKDCRDEVHVSYRDNKPDHEDKSSAYSPREVSSQEKNTIYYCMATSVAPPLKASLRSSCTMGAVFDDVWGPPVMPVLPVPPSSAARTPAVPTSVVSKGHLGAIASNELHPAKDSTDSIEKTSRLAFAAVFGDASVESSGPSAATAPDAMGANLDVDDLLKQFTSKSLFFGDVEDD